MVEITLMSAVLCILSPVTIPVPMSPVPFSMATFVVYLAGMLLGAKKGAASVLLYLLIGMVGLPVFSGFSGGIGKLLGPTGGYIIGYIPCALVTGVLVDKGTGRYNGAAKKQFLWNVFSMVAGTVLCYVFGTVWFIVVMNGTYTPMQALLVCVVPYLLFELIKILAAVAVAVPIRKVLRKMTAA